MPIDDIAAHPENPKAHSVDTLVASIRRFGFIDPVVVDQRTGLNVSGHGRVKALQAMRDAGQPPPAGITAGWEVPVFVGWASADDVEARAALVALNRTTELGGWDDGALLGLLERLEGQEAAFDGIGFGGADLQELRAQLGDFVPEFDPVGVDEQPRLDQRSPIVCGACGASVDPKSGEVRG